MCVSVLSASVCVEECVFNVSESEGHLETLNVMLGVVGQHMKVQQRPRANEVTAVDKSEKCQGLPAFP